MTVVIFSQAVDREGDLEAVVGQEVEDRVIEQGGVAGHLQRHRVAGLLSPAPDKTGPTDHFFEMEERFATKKANVIELVGAGLLKGQLEGFPGDFVGHGAIGFFAAVAVATAQVAIVS